MTLLDREIRAHWENNPRQFVTVESGKPKRGGAPSDYYLKADGESSQGDPYDVLLCFQDGHPGTVGYNGVLDSALLSILIDRQEGFLSGPWPSEEGREALHHLRKALEAMDRRVADRVKRDVMNKDQK
jgi:hypothetical protein